MKTSVDGGLGSYESHTLHYMGVIMDVNIANLIFFYRQLKKALQTANVFIDNLKKYMSIAQSTMTFTVTCKIIILQSQKSAQAHPASKQHGQIIFLAHLEKKLPTVGNTGNWHSDGHLKLAVWGKFLLQVIRGHLKLRGL